jgi:hypothetical protein
MKRLLSAIFITFFIFSIIVVPHIVTCQTATPTSTNEPTPTETSPISPLLIAVIVVVVVAVVGAVSALLLVRRRVNEKTLRKYSPHAFEEWVIKRFNGKPSDPSSGVNGFTEGGQPLLIMQTDHVSLADVEDFVKVLEKGKAQKGTIVAFNFEKDTIEGKITAMDNGIELQMLRIAELANKRFNNRLKSMAASQVAFDSQPPTYIPEDRGVPEIKTYERMPRDPENIGIKPRVFISNSNTKVADQVKKMLDFLDYDYVMGDKEETTVPIPENKFGLMRNCDCAIINIAAAEQERRYSGLYILNSNIISEINAAYLKYNTQVILLVERKVDLPPNIKGLKRIEYDNDDLSFNSAMDLKKILEDFQKI